MDVGSTEVPENVTLADNNFGRDIRTMAYVEIFSILVIALIGLSGNCLVLVAIATNKKLHTSSNVFVCNLSISDGIVGTMLIFTPINIVSDS